MDAQAALDYLHTREDLASDRWIFLTKYEKILINVICARIIIFGRSLGGAVAVDLATRYVMNVNKLINA